ncbi:flagellar hook capping FlgD N-terminal domain-containing protein [Chachezhania sediminis]|uniref:flagellar hook capping FlgD N-terminal domain-containing protein n=1 Tax=Chachezhania sediminis TaxID=2599291 RepID=UPI00131C48FC|nr:flagellar hook capping FlgD N-terminal domain-containing protein [Chachezhania sediminis]
METSTVGPQPVTRPVDTSQGDKQAGSPGTGTTAIASDFETFLKMLTAQARYQDPLEPIDSTEYAAQLAQFSMVEQQVKTNDFMSNLIRATETSNMAALAGWVGMEVRAAVPVDYDGAPVTVIPSIADGADRAELVVHDTFGAEVQRLPVPLDGGEVVWAGVSQDGAPLPSGTYALTVESFTQDSLVGTTKVESYARVKEAQIANGNVSLLVAGGQSIAAGDVTSVRKAT